LTAPTEKPTQVAAKTENEGVSNRAAVAQAQSPASREMHTTILLIDSSNVAFADLTNAQREILRFLKTVPPDERVGLCVLHKFGFQFLLEPTEDHAQVASKLALWMSSAQDLLQAQHEEDRNRQNMEYVQHITDLLYTNGNTPTGETDSFFPVDPQLRSQGDAPPRGALVALQGVGRRLAAIPGHKSLVWVASDNVLADFSEKAPDNERGDKNLDPLAMRARETLNEARVSLYPLDASQLDASGVRAEQHSANAEVKPTSNPPVETLTMSKIAPGLAEEAQEALEKSQRDIYPGRVTAQLQQDGRWTDNVDVFLVVRDDSGLHATVAGKRLGLALTPPTYRRNLKDGLTIEEKLPKMPDGALLRLIVIDENSRRIGSVTIGANE